MYVERLNNKFDTDLPAYLAAFCESIKDLTSVCRVEIASRTRKNLEWLEDFVCTIKSK